MLTLDLVRTIEVLAPNGDWISGHIGQLEEGDVFRINEPDGTPHLNEHSRREYLCLKMPSAEVQALDHEPERPAMLCRQVARPAA